MKGKDNDQFAMDQPLLMEAAAEPVADGTIQTQRGWVVKEGVIDPTNYRRLGENSPNSSIFVR